MSDSSTSSNVRVLLRVRPFNARESQLGNQSCVTPTINNNTIEIATKPEPRQYSYDHVVDSTVEQHRIFTLCGKTITDTCLKGYNGTIFAYGIYTIIYIYNLSNNCIITIFMCIIFVI
jgi:kinesin family protein 15